jgi:hypothetical protein
VVIRDMCVMGAQDMINAAEEAGDDSIFLTGKTQEDEFVQVDLQQDAITPQEIIHSFDVDSFIWVTPFPKFINSVDIYTMPLIRRKAPIGKHNHVYVDLLLPPSEDDALSLGARNDWWTRRFRLSQIPHIALGKLGDGSGAVNLYMFFPRMTHQHEYTKRWAAPVPWDVQNLFWDKVLRPAMRNVTSQLDHPYVGLTRENMELKSGRGARKKQGETSKAPSFPFRRRAFMKLLDEIRNLVSGLSLPKLFAKKDSCVTFQIDESDGTLARFGSDFCVLEMKGGKHRTKTTGFNAQICLQRCWVDFEREFSGLDWEYMKNQENGGELFCDIGITHHPNHPVPLVGLWRLDSLEASFGAAGYNMGTLHNLNTLSQYGGLQAEMSKTRCERTHIAFRSSYNLAYEVTRSLDNGRDLFKAGDAYSLHPDYLWDTNRVMDIYQNDASTKSFGVRDEFRVGGQTLDTLGTEMDSLVSAYYCCPNLQRCADCD